MSDVTCENEDCTYNETGLCVLEHEPPDCPRLVAGFEIGGGDSGEEGLDEPVDEGGVDTVALPRSDTLSLDDVRSLMRNEYCLLVGLVGEPDTGKTACIVSLYLLLAQRALQGYSFSDSRSLVALDELARGARMWAGSMPDQMTTHTKSPDGTAAGFLHFKLRCKDCGDLVHVLIPEIPGEWTSSLIDRNRTDRFGFLKSVEVIWLMLDGRALVRVERRQYAMHRADMLLGRLMESLAPEVPSVRLVISHYDSGKPPEHVEQGLRELGVRYGIELTINYIASFSRDSKVAAGTGIAGLIRATIGEPGESGGFWPWKTLLNGVAAEGHAGDGGRGE